MPRPMPTQDDLTPKQRAIMRLPDEGRYVVSGPPGTGKTIIALMKSIAMRERHPRVTLITYNENLKNYLQAEIRHEYFISSNLLCISQFMKF